MAEYLDKTGLTKYDTLLKEYVLDIADQLAQGIEGAKTIARGRATGYVFSTKAAMDTWLADPENKKKLVLGDNLYIVAVDTPDYWWDTAADTYHPLETQKVDLSEYAKKTELPTVNNATLTIQKNGTTVDTFTANASSNKTINITVPTGAAASKAVDSSISAGSSSANLPTSAAVANFVEGKGYLTSVSLNDYVDNSSLNAKIGQLEENWANTLDDYLTEADAQTTYATNSSVEGAFNNLYDNVLSGYVEATTVATSSSLGLVKIGYQSTNKNYAVQLDTNSKMYVNVPWTDTHVTSVDNHYAPAENTASALNATGGTLTDIANSANGTQVVTGLKRDAKGHVVGVTSVALKATNTGDTKNTAGSTDTSSKIFIVGATSQAANPQTYSQDTAFVGTDGCLYSNNTKVLVTSDVAAIDESDIIKLFS